MKPAPFKYIAAASLDQALTLKAEFGDEARFLAGGQSLVPMLNFRVAQPKVLIDLNLLSQLSGIACESSASLRIGALTRYRALERDQHIVQTAPLVREALPHIAHPQIRNRGTLGGNLAHADPASELPAIVVALRGRLRARSIRGERWIEARDFFLAPLTTALQADEMLVEVQLPAHAKRSGSCFMEVARRRGDFALMGAAVVLTHGVFGQCNDVRVVLCGAGDTPTDVSDAASGLIGHSVDVAAIDHVAASVQKSIDPPGNVHASKAFQRHLAGVLVKRALGVAAERAQHG
ncbi:MAG: xanthine dehydrogenase family protein subunit M [Bradyrhizobiaceae bacterium]|nr:xanthine dehydrogenase family protein subunit M [Bradyrhizobiaceae bacterium]